MVALLLATADARLFGRSLSSPAPESTTSTHPDTATTATLCPASGEAHWRHDVLHARDLASENASSVFDVSPSSHSFSSSSSLFNVSHWTSRLGNNFVQISNGLVLAACCRGTVEFPAHASWPKLARRVSYAHPSFPVTFRPNASLSRCSTAFEADLLYGWSAYAYAYTLPIDTEEALFQCDFDLHAALLAVTLDEAPGCTAACAGERSFGDNVLTIHVRSGDIFAHAPGEMGYDDGMGGYAQYPAAFYAAVLSHRVWHRVIFITDPGSKDEKKGLNPVFSHFQKPEVLGSWPHTAFEFRDNGTLAEDTGALRCATHLVAAHSSFSYYAMATSRALKSYYVPRGAQCMAYTGRCDAMPPGAKLVAVALPGWDLSATWRNTAEERERMVAYALAPSNDTFAVYDELPHPGRWPDW